MKLKTVSAMKWHRLVHIFALGAILVGFGAGPGSASVTSGIHQKAPHKIAVAAFGSPLLPGKVTLLSTDSRRLLLSVSSVKILPVLLERNEETTTLFKVVAPYLWFVAALFILTLMARREVRQAAIPAIRRKPAENPWVRQKRRNLRQGRG